MVAEYLESIGIKTRIYMTRFVRLTMSRTNLLKQKNKEGVDLPMGNTPLGRSFGDCLFIQPIIAKDYAEEIDKAAAFTISSRSMQSIYGACAKYTMEKELSNNISAYGYPNFEQPQYWEGMERYRNKYQEYVKLGLFEAKEVLHSKDNYFTPSVAEDYGWGSFFIILLLCALFAFSLLSLVWVPHKRESFPTE